MHIPFQSIFTLATELLITASVYYIIYYAYTKGIFIRWFAFAVLAYETVFNISYMFSRAANGEEHGVVNPYQTAVAIFHGIFSLLMFIMLVIFFLIAARTYKRGQNYFLNHKRLTAAFVVAWGISIISGALLFVSLYFNVGF